MGAGRMCDKETAFDWYLLGFQQSAEGYNNEYPFSYKEDVIRETIRTRFENEWSERSDV